MSNERQILDYARGSRASGVANGFRLIGVVICVFTGLVGLGILGLGAIEFLEMLVYPTMATPHHVFEISVISLIGLLIAGFSIRWGVKAIRPKPKAAIDQNAQTK